MKALFYTAVAVFIGLAGVVAFYAFQTPDNAVSTRVVLHIDTSEMPGESNESAPNIADLGQADNAESSANSFDTANDIQVSDLYAERPAPDEPKPAKSSGRLSEPDDVTADLDDPVGESEEIAERRRETGRRSRESLQADRPNGVASQIEDAEAAAEEELAYVPGTTLGPIESDGPSDVDPRFPAIPGSTVGGITASPGALSPRPENSAISTDANASNAEAETEQADEAQRLVDELAASLDTESSPDAVAEPVVTERVAASEATSPLDQSLGEPDAPVDSLPAETAAVSPDIAEPQISEAPSGTADTDAVSETNDREATSAEITALLQESSEAAPSTDESATLTEDAPQQAETPAAVSAEEPSDLAVADDSVDLNSDTDNAEADSQPEVERPSQLAALTPEVAPDVVDEASLVPPPPAPERRPASIPSVEVAAANGWANSIAASAGRKPAKVALLLRGIGQNSQDSQAAIDGLPSAVSLAFLPDGDALLWAVRARERGHEVIVQLPLEPSDYPANNPGPNTLLSSDSVEQNVSRMSTVLSNFEGYSGVTNYQGGKFLRSKEALRPILENVKSRGLIYVGEGTSSHNVARRLAGEIKLRYGQPNVHIDGNASPLTVKRALARLIAIAHQRGSAIAIGDVSSATIEQVQAWSEALTAHGITLVPVGALAQADGAS